LHLNKHGVWNVIYLSTIIIINWRIVCKPQSLIFVIKYIFYPLFFLRHFNSDIWTTIWYNFCDNLFFLLFFWSKTMERKKGRENKKIMWVWERKLSKNCHKVVVQISFLFQFYPPVLLASIFPLHINSIFSLR